MREMWRCAAWMAGVGLATITSALAAVECPRRADIDCWRRAALEKIDACDSDLAEPLKRNRRMLERIKIESGEPLFGAFGATRFKRNGKPQRIYLRDDVYVSLMNDRRPMRQPLEPGEPAPYEFTSTLAILVHEMAHAAYGGNPLLKDEHELIAQHIQTVCVDTDNVQKGCGYTIVCSGQPLNRTYGEFGGCDDASMRATEARFEARLASGEIPTSCPLSYNLFLALYPDETTRSKSRAFINDMAKKYRTGE